MHYWFPNRCPRGNLSLGRQPAAKAPAGALLARPAEPEPVVSERRQPRELSSRLIVVKGIPAGKGFIVGAKTSVWGYADGDAPGLPRDAPERDVEKTVSLIRRLYPGWNGDTVADAPLVDEL